MSAYKIISWNVNGIRASVKKGFYDIVKTLDADVFMVQETKATVDIVKQIGEELEGYEVFANEAEKKGYSGTAIFSKIRPISNSIDIGIADHDQEGRVTIVEFDEFYLVDVYVPNSGRELVRLDYRKSWDEDFLKYLKSLERKKPVIVGGDLNVAHEEMDLARPKPNYNKTAGYTQTEIDGFEAFQAKGFVDTFRTLHPDEVKYSFWNQRFGARAKNVGWRIDYFMVSESIMKNVESATILNDIFGSDHCPIGVELKF